MQPDEVLEKAAEYIAEHGWHQGSAYKYGIGIDFPAACAVGAVSRVTGGSRYDDALDFLSAQVGGVYVPLWNDDPARTKEEVIETMREAAQQWRKENA